MKKRFFFFLLALVVIGFSSCTEDELDEQLTVSVTSVTLNQSTLSLNVGGIYTLVSTLSPSNALDTTVIWTSSNASVASVSKGKVVAWSAGTATITAKAGDKTASCTVTVTALTPPVTTVTDIDGNVYHTVKIGTQTWMVENLKVTKYNDGTEIPNVTTSLSWGNLSTGAYCYYSNDVAVGSKYGALYNWYAVNTGKLAPAGWHVPTDAEWTVLENYLIANGYNYDGTTTGNKIAQSLASTTDWASYTSTGAIGDDLTKNNRSGFTALPAGYRQYNGWFDGIGEEARWWSTTSDWPGGLVRGLYYNDTYLDNYYQDMRYGLSVRCVKD